MALMTAYLDGGPDVVTKLLIDKLGEGPGTAIETMYGLTSVAGALLMEAAATRGVSPEEVLQEIAIEFAQEANPD